MVAETFVVFGLTINILSLVIGFLGGTIIIIMISLLMGRKRVMFNNLHEQVKEASDNLKLASERIDNIDGILNEVEKNAR